MALASDTTGNIDDTPADNKLRFYIWGNNDVTGKGIKYAICLSFRTQTRGIQICAGTIGGAAIRGRDNDVWGGWQVI